MIDQTKIGNFIKLLRKEKGQTQEELAEFLGTSSKSVSRWENGKTLPDLSVMVELADHFDVEIGEIIDGERKGETMDMETKKDLMKIADYADKRKKQAIIRAIIFFGLDMLFSGMTIGAAILVLKSDGQINAGYAVIPMLFALVFSSALTVERHTIFGKG